MREEIIRLLQSTPFRPYLIVMDSGQQVAVRHSENVAYDPERPTKNCYALSDGIMHSLPWEKISNVAWAYEGQRLPT
jgi:hypothetical protein